MTGPSKTLAPSEQAELRRTDDGPPDTLEGAQSTLMQFQAELAQLRRHNDQLREQLQWYATEVNWPHNAREDAGARARAALLPPQPRSGLASATKQAPKATPCGGCLK